MNFTLKQLRYVEAAGRLGSIAKAAAELRAVGGDAAGFVRIACYVTTAPALLPPILRSISKDFPQMSVQVLEGNMETIVSFLDEGKADLVFTYTSAINAGQKFLPLFQPPPFALISNDDPMSEWPSVTIQDLAPKPMVLLDLPRARDYFLNLFNANGCDPHIAHSTRSAEVSHAQVSVKVPAETARD